MTKSKEGLTTITSIQNVKEEHIVDFYLHKATRAEQEWLDERAAHWDKECVDENGKLNKRSSFAKWRKDFVDKFMPELTVKKQVSKKSNSLVEVLKAAREKEGK